MREEEGVLQSRPIIDWSYPVSPFGDSGMRLATGISEERWKPETCGILFFCCFVVPFFLSRGSNGCGVLYCGEVPYRPSEAPIPWLLMNSYGREIPELTL